MRTSSKALSVSLARRSADLLVCSTDPAHRIGRGQGHPCSGSSVVRSSTRDRRLLWLALIALAVPCIAAGRSGVPDSPFRQAVSVQFQNAAELEGVTFQRLAVDQDDIPYVLTDRGVARSFDHRLALDRSFRPLATKRVLDLATRQGTVFYLLQDALLSNDFAGQYGASFSSGPYRSVCVAPEGTALLAAPTNLLIITSSEQYLAPFAFPRETERLCAAGNQFFVLASNAIYRVAGSAPERIHQGQDMTALALRGTNLLIGTRRGYYAIDPVSGRTTLPLQERLPSVDIRCLLGLTNGVWVGTGQGVFFHAGPNWIRYYASRRWLKDDGVLDLAEGPEDSVYVLTRTGLSQIRFDTTTLAAKAQFYERKIRRRHLRYGFCAELRLQQPGDPASAEMIDTDNDGSWTSYYLASLVFKYAATGDESARAQAWESFETLERLQAINRLDGFPSRTFERTGHKVSDPERWHLTPDRAWEWKAHTSSDEITAQTFAAVVLFELGARTVAERSRIANFYDRIIAHIVRHDLYLVDVDGQPTLWGRWNPEYVNHYPPTIVDRRLNSAEILAFLQFGSRVTGKDLYGAKARELIDRHGYLRNLTNTMAAIRPTPGFVFHGNDMGNEWNHSDDLLAFVNSWTLCRTAFTEELRAAYADSVRDHWQIEQRERNPLFAFILAMTGTPQFDLEGALWTLRNYPLDLVTWTIHNSTRRDLARLPPNFRQEETEELLPPDERPVMRWNGNPFRLDGGDGGHTELAGDEFLLPYWMGRYLGLIR